VHVPKRSKQKRESSSPYCTVRSPDDAAAEPSQLRIR